MNLSRALAALPDGARCALTIGSGDMTVGELRDALGRAPEFRMLTTGQAAEMLGYSPDTWREWATAGDVRGAYRDEGEGMWRLPAKACEEHLARLQAKALNRRRKRGPWEAKTGSVEPDIAPRLVR